MLYRYAQMGDTGKKRRYWNSFKFSGSTTKEREVLSCISLETGAVIASKTKVRKVKG